MAGAGTRQQHRGTWKMCLSGRKYPLVTPPRKGTLSTPGRALRSMHLGMRFLTAAASKTYTNPIDPGPRLALDALGHALLDGGHSGCSLCVCARLSAGLERAPGLQQHDRLLLRVRLRLAQAAVRALVHAVRTPRFAITAKSESAVIQAAPEYRRTAISVFVQCSVARQASSSMTASSFASGCDSRRLRYARSYTLQEATLPQCEFPGIRLTAGKKKIE